MATRADGVRKDTGFHKLMLGNTTDTKTLTWPTGGRGLEDGDTVEMCFKTEVTNFGDRVVSDCATVTVGDTGVCDVSQTVSVSGEGPTSWDDSATVESFSGCESIRVHVDAGDGGLERSSNRGVRLKYAGDVVFSEETTEDSWSFSQTVNFDTGGADGDLVLEVDDGEATASPP